MTDTLGGVVGVVIAGLRCTDDIQSCVIGEREYGILRRKKLIRGMYSMPDETPDQRGDRLRFFTLTDAGKALVPAVKHPDPREVGRIPLKLRSAAHD